ncbi:hypothetical protein HY947_05400 [Candidatus Gottesmanbacteria bacterium]|nr:hypothetical protein [Candidatus Gottesmanbacteria bacterium]
MIPLVILYGFYLIWGIILQFLPLKSTTLNLAYNSYAVLYFYGALCCIRNSNTVSIKSSIGKSLLFFGLGVGSYGIGLLFWLYYNFIARIEIPFPSFADIFFVLFIPLIAVGVFYILSLFTKLITRTFVLQSLAIIALSAIAVLGLLNKPTITGDASFLAVFFNIAYPIGDTILVSSALIALRVGGGKMHEILKLLIIGLLFQAVADFFFTYRSSHTIYWNGDISDIMYATSGFILSATLLRMRKHFFESSEHISTNLRQTAATETNSPQNI